MGMIHVVGVTDAGLDSLGAEALRRVRGARLVAGGRRQLAFAAGLDAEKRLVEGDLGALADGLAAAAESGDVAVLASGDPLFHGIGAALLRRLGPGRVTVHPNVGALQLAFARAGLAWDAAALVSAHGRGLAALRGLDPGATRVGVLTDSDSTPAAAARELLALGWPADARAWVMENLGGPDERVTACGLAEVAGRAFGPLNVLLADRPDPGTAALAAAAAFGLPDAAFERRAPVAGLITKAEVRAIALSKLGLFPAARVWDVGAGSGSVAIEAARLCRRGRVWAVEKDAEDCAVVRANIARHRALNVELVEGRAPEALAGLPEDPDSVFIGGSGGGLEAIVRACCARLRPGGSLVATTVTLENTAAALQALKQSGLAWDCVQVQVSRRRGVADLNRMEAENPVYVFWGTKQ